MHDCWTVFVMDFELAAPVICNVNANNIMSVIIMAVQHQWEGQGRFCYHSETMSLVECLSC